MPVFMGRSEKKKWQANSVCFGDLIKSAKMLAGGQRGLVFVLLLGTAATLADDVCVCTNTCLHKRDGQCNDGGPGSSDGTCELGSDRGTQRRAHRLCRCLR